MVRNSGSPNFIVKSTPNFGPTQTFCLRTMSHHKHGGHGWDEVDRAKTPEASSHARQNQEESWDEAVYQDHGGLNITKDA